MAKDIKSMVELTKIKSDKVGHIFSVRSEEELQNGYCVKLGDVEVENPEIYKAEKAAEGDLVALVAHPWIVKGACSSAQDQEHYFAIDAETPARAYELGLEDFFAVTEQSLADGTDTDAFKSNETFLVPDGNKWKVASVNPEKGTVLQFVRKYDRTAPVVQMFMAQKDKNFKVPTFYNFRVVNHSL